MPKTNKTYWEAKISRNVARDKKTLRDLEEQGWRSLTIWECELRELENVRDKVENFLA